MAKAFPVTFVYNNQTYLADVITQRDDKGLFVSAEVPDPYLQQVLPDGKIKGVYLDDTGKIANAGAYDGHLDILQCIIDAITKQREHKVRRGLWN